MTCVDDGVPYKEGMLKVDDSIIKMCIKSNFNIDVVMLHELSFQERFKLFFLKKEKLETDETFGFKDTIIIKRLDNKNVLIKNIKGSTKELL